MPYKTGTRLLGVARNPANGFPARLLARWAAGSRPTWPCRPSSRLTCVPLFCAIVIPSTLYYKLSAVRLLRFTHVLSPARLGRPLADPSRSDACPSLAALPQRPDSLPVAGTPSHLSRTRLTSLPAVATTFIVTFPTVLR